MFQVWDTRTGKLLRRQGGHKGCVTGLAFDELTRVLFSVSLDGCIALWCDRGSLLHVFHHLILRTNSPPCSLGLHSGDTFVLYRSTLRSWNPGNWGTKSTPSFQCKERIKTPCIVLTWIDCLEMIEVLLLYRYRWTTFLD